MKRALIIAAGGALIAASYVIVISGLVPDAQVGSVAVAAIALPGLVSGLVMTFYIAWEQRNIRNAKGMADELSAQLVRKEIEIGRLATVDELTGLATRREFDEDVRLEFARARRHGRELSMLLLQIDDIAELGEHFGSLSKGYLLSEVSAIVRRLLRAHDIGCRYSQDSLAMLLPETNSQQAAIVASKIRAAVAEHEFLGELKVNNLRLTVSQGIAALTQQMTEPHALVDAAEAAMVQARTAGFDQVHVAQQETPPPPASPTTDPSIAA